MEGQSAASVSEDVDPQIALHASRTECESCHESVRPETDTHPASGDCVSCHAYPTWQPLGSEEEPTTFSHDPMPEACISCHEDDRPTPEHNPNLDCVMCHTHPDWSVIN